MGVLLASLAAPLAAMFDFDIKVGLDGTSPTVTPAPPNVHAHFNPTPAHHLGGLVAVLLIALILKTGWLATCLLYALLKPQRLRQGGQILAAGMLKSFLIGLLAFLCYLVFAIILVAMLKRTHLALALWIPLVICYFYQLLSGSAMLYLHLGEKLLANLASPHLGSSLWAVACGGMLVLALGFLFPIGYLLWALLGAACLGASTRTLLSPRPATGISAPA